MDISSIIKQTSHAGCQKALDDFLSHFLTPAFGALPKAEVELLVLNMLEQLGATSDDPEVYELVSKLRITRSKARNLIYNRDLRRSSAKQLDERVKVLLTHPLLQKNGELFVLEVENPLLADHLKSRVQKLGFISDGSFSPNLVKLGLDAISALLESYLSETERRQVRKILLKAGAPDTSLRGMLKAMIKQMAKKVAADVGDHVTENVSDYISPLLNDAGDVLLIKMRKLFYKEE